MAPFTDGGRTVDRTNWSTHRTSPTTRSAAPSRWRSISRCAAAPTAASRSTTSCARCGACTASRAAPRAGLRRSPVHDGRCRGAAGGGERRRGVRARFLRPLHRRAARWPTIARLLAARGAGAAQARCRPRLVGRRPPRAAADGARVAGRAAVATPLYVAGLDVGDEIAQIGGSTGDRRRRRAARRSGVSGRATASRSCSSIAPARSKEGELTLGEDPARWSSCRSKRPAARSRRRRDVQGALVEVTAVDARLQRRSTQSTARE